MWRAQGTTAVQRGACGGRDPWRDPRRPSRAGSVRPSLPRIGGRCAVGECGAGTGRRRRRRDLRVAAVAAGDIQRAAAGRRHPAGDIAPAAIRRACEPRAGPLSRRLDSPAGLCRVPRGSNVPVCARACCGAGAGMRCVQGQLAKRAAARGVQTLGAALPGVRSRWRPNTHVQGARAPAVPGRLLRPGEARGSLQAVLSPLRPAAPRQDSGCLPRALPQNMHAKPVTRQRFALYPMPHSPYPTP